MSFHYAASTYLLKEISRIKPPGQRRHLFKSNLIPTSFSSLFPPLLHLMMFLCHIVVFRVMGMSSITLLLDLWRWLSWVDRVIFSRGNSADSCLLPEEITESSRRLLLDGYHNGRCKFKCTFVHSGEDMHTITKWFISVDGGGCLTFNNRTRWLLCVRNVFESHVCRDSRSHASIRKY